MRPRTTLTLLVMVCLLAGLVWLMRDRSPHADAIFPAPPPPEKLTSLSIAAQDLQIHCEKNRDDWYIVKPLKARADSRAVERILRAVSEMSRVETITAEQRQRRGLNLNDYGVGEKPRAELRVGNSRTNLSILIGRDTLDDVLYVRYPPEDAVVATSTGVLAVLPKHIDELRDRRLIRGTAAEVNRLEVGRQTAGFMQAVRKDGQWTLLQPVKGPRLNNQKLLSILKTLEDGRAEYFTSDVDAQKAGLDDSQAVLQISVWCGDDAEGQKLIIGKDVPERAGEVYAKSGDSDSIFTVRKTVPDAFNVPAGSLRDPAVFQVSRDAVQFLCLMDGERRVEFTMKDAEWQITEPRRMKADTAIMSAFLSMLFDLKVEEFIDDAVPLPPEMGLDPAPRSMELSTSVPAVNPDGQKEDKAASSFRKVLLIGNETADGRMVRVRFKDESSVLLLGREPVRSILDAGFVPSGKSSRGLTNSAGTAVAAWVNPLLYCNRTVLELERRSINSISVLKLGQEQTVCRDETGAWRPVPPMTNSVKGDVVVDILDSISRVEALRVESLETDNLASYGLDEPAAKVTVGMAEGKGIRKTIMLGFRAGSDGVYAMIQGQDMIFVLPKKLVGRLLRDLAPGGANEG